MNLLFYLFIVLTIIGLDQYTKKLIVTFIECNTSESYLNGFLNIVNVKNYGAGFSILQNQRIILILIPLIVSIIIAVYIITNKKRTKIETISLLFILSGAIGNLIDRMFKGYVIDFIDLNFFGYHYPSFNVADSFITVGAIILIVYLFILERKHGNKKNNS